MASREIDRLPKGLSTFREREMHSRLLRQAISEKSVLDLIENDPQVKSKERIVNKLTTFVENMFAGKAIIDKVLAEGKPISLPPNSSEALRAWEIAHDYVIGIPLKESLLRSEELHASRIGRFIKKMKVEVEYLKNVELGKVEPDKVKTVRAFYKERFEVASRRLPVPKLD